MPFLMFLTCDRCQRAHVGPVVHVPGRHVHARLLDRAKKQGWMMTAGRGSHFEGDTAKTVCPDCMLPSEVERMRYTEVTRT